MREVPNIRGHFVSIVARGGGGGCEFPTTYVMMEFVRRRRLSEAQCGVMACRVIRRSPGLLTPRVPYLKRKKRNPYRITLLSVCPSVRPSVKTLFSQERVEV
ncbi:hypothetical protein EVAR_45582_1 [Eumeta japonica]|uniref:Uncharacterized protein n=1 Tax=Eumeta variegata TaxID=151549 RepID=A0A4C1YTL5_EUMVA|nr:hypothetical protein EVAR_45582_1 [Eumeta japonica]